MAYYSPSSGTYHTTLGMGKYPALAAADRARDQYEKSTDFFKNSNGTSGNAIAHAAAAEAAAKLKVDVADTTLKEQKAGFKQNKKTNRQATKSASNKLNPWRESGLNALGMLDEKLVSGPGEFEASPGYEFRLAEGQKAMERSAAAKGNLLSGKTLKGVTRYGQNYATNDYDNFLKRYYDSLTPLQNQSNVGYTASQQQGTYGMRGAENEVNLRTNSIRDMATTRLYGGEAGAEGVMNSANIIAAQKTADEERDYAYEAWKRGDSF